MNLQLTNLQPTNNALLANDNATALAPCEGGEETCFDYQTIPEGNREKLLEIAGKIKKLRAIEGNSKREAGDELLLAKPIAGHGNWGTWLDREFHMSKRTARNYMKLAREYGGKTANFADLNLGKSTPAADGKGKSSAQEMAGALKNVLRRAERNRPNCQADDVALLLWEDKRALPNKECVAFVKEVLAGLIVLIQPELEGVRANDQ